MKTLEDYRTKRMMGTESGHRWFNQQLDRQIEFFKAILAQNEITKLP